jgi:DNA-binding transcriptional LysR family regulator
MLPRCENEYSLFGRHSSAHRLNAVVAGRLNAYYFRTDIPRCGRIVDRIDAMKVFVAALDEGSLAGAGRKLGRSPAAVSRAIAFLEARVGAQLLHRTTRSIKLSEAGERYAVACRRILTDLEEADIIAAGERSAPRGSLTLAAPVRSGEMVLRPILDAFMDAHPAVSVRLYLLDRQVNLIDEGVDVALRIAHPCRLDIGCDPGRRSAPGGSCCPALPGTASTH